MEQIALMKPKAQSEHSDGMLEFLEDIVGTSSLKEPIEELAKKVEELGEARGEKVRMRRGKAPSERNSGGGGGGGGVRIGRIGGGGGGRGGGRGEVEKRRGR